MYTREREDGNMEQTVYVDLYFIINFAMDFLCFFLVARLLSLRESILRSLAASALGGVYACVSLIVPLDVLLSLALDALAAIAMSAIAFGRKKEPFKIVTYAVVYAAVSIVLGGAMTALFELFNKIGLDEMLGSREDADGISVWLFALLAFLGGLLTVLGTRGFKRRSAAQKCRVKLCYKEKSIELDGLCDSGNLLREPISAKPCIAVEARRMRELLPPKLLCAISEKSTDKLGREEMGRIRVVFMRTASGEKMSYALRMDKIELDFGKGMSEADAFIAILETPIRASGAEALVPSELCLMR